VVWACIFNRYRRYDAAYDAFAALVLNPLKNGR
jgi:hypothetical protein